MLDIFCTILNLELFKKYTYLLTLKNLNDTSFTVNELSFQGHTI